MRSVAMRAEADQSTRRFASSIRIATDFSGELTTLVYAGGGGLGGSTAEAALSDAASRDFAHV